MGMRRNVEEEEEDELLRRERNETRAKADGISREM